jgi:hypothetical protein
MLTLTFYSTRFMYPPFSGVNNLLYSEAQHSRRKVGRATAASTFDTSTLGPRRQETPDLPALGLSSLVVLGGDGDAKQLLVRAAQPLRGSRRRGRERREAAGRPSSPLDFSTTRRSFELAVPGWVDTPSFSVALIVSETFGPAGHDGRPREKGRTTAQTDAKSLCSFSSRVRK